jgi:hypothetical protein
VRDLLAHGACVCVFPEGGVNRGPHLGALRTGLARMALDARDTAGVRGLQIVPVGITYESPLEYRSRVLIEVGAPLELDHWTPDEGRRPESQLTTHIGTLMRALTRNAPDQVAAQALGAVVAVAGAASPDASLLAATQRWQSLATEIYGPGIAQEIGADQRFAPARDLIAQLEALSPGDSPVVLLRAWREAAHRRQHPAAMPASSLPSPPARTAPFGALLALAGVLLNGPAWFAVRRLARSSAFTPHDVIPRTIIPGLYLMAAWYVVLTLSLGAALVRSGVPGWLGVSAALALIVCAPTLGDFALRWRDAIADRRRVRLLARELPDLTARIDHAVQAMHASPHVPVSTSVAAPAHNERQVI